MVVSDFPRQADHKAEESLRGRAGKKLDELLIRATIQPDKVFFTSLLKCHPGRMGFFPEDDSPAKCFNFLMQQMQIVKPLIVVLAGPEAAAWVLTRGTGETVEPLVKWEGRFYRRREVYGDLRFVVIPHPTVLCKDPNDGLEDACVKAFTTIKEYIKTKQKDEPTPDIELIDLKKLIIHDKKSQIEAFKWKKPETLNLPKIEESPKNP